MSEVWTLDRAQLAAALPITQGLAAFKPLLDRLADVPFPPVAPAAPASAAERMPDVAEREANAYACGLEEGQRQVEALLADERAALARLARNLQALRREPPQALAVLLAATVDRLVRQVVGEVGVDADLLLARAEAAALLIADETVPGRMRLHPDDVARLEEAGLPCELVGDPALAPGTVLLETRTGWIDHGPEIALNRLGGALDMLGAPV